VFVRGGFWSQGLGFRVLGSTSFFFVFWVYNKTEKTQKTCKKIGFVVIIIIIFWR
jgi:hypothetical protein